jgi:hypothetical protein
MPNYQVKNVLTQEIAAEFYGVNNHLALLLEEALRARDTEAGTPSADGWATLEINPKERYQTDDA